MMKKSQVDQAKSSLAINVGDLRQEKRTELPAPAYSSKAKTKMSAEANGVVAEYDYKSNGVKLKAHYELTDRGLHMYIKTDEIEEADTDSEKGKVLYLDGSEEVKYFYGENPGDHGGITNDLVCCSDYPSKMFDRALQCRALKRKRNSVVRN